MPTPYERMFGVAPAPAPGPEQLPGIPAEFQNLPPGQFAPFPQPIPVEQQPGFVRSVPSGIQAPEPIPYAPPLPPGFTGQIPPGFTGQEQGQGLPPAPPPATPLPGASQAPPSAVPAHTQPHPHGPGMVQQFDTRINANQKAQEAASLEQQQAITQGATDVAQAKQGQATERLGNAVELADKQKEIQQHNQKLDEIDAANLKQAKEATIPEFWKGREGARVGSTIAVALAGIGAGLLGQTSNTALNAIQHNIDSYFSREKEKIDNMYKYAEQQGKFNAQTRMNYAQDLLNLKDQHSYVMAAAADRVDAVAIQSKGAVDAAAQKTLSTGLRVQAEKDKLNVRNINSEILLRNAQSAEAYGKAEEAKARAKNGGYLTPGQTMQFINQNSKEIERNFGEVTRKGGLNEEAHHLAQNIKMAREQPNNPAPFVGLLDSLVTSYSGGKVTQQQYNNWLHHIAPGADRIEQVIEQFQTGKASPTQRKNLMDIALGKYNGIRGELKEAHEKFRAIKAGPEYAQVPGAPEMLNRKENEIFGNSPGFNGKEPDLGLGTGGAGNTKVQMKDGTVAEFDASGKRVK